MTPDQISAVVKVVGHVVLPLLSPGEVEELIDTLGEINGPGQRNVLRFPAVAQFALSPAVLELVRPTLTGQPRPVRAIYFDKTPSNNWLVSWHQDLTIALRARADAPGFGPWTTKDGVPHAQPPAELLEQMVTVRLHLDDCDENNGALRVLSGSHNFGRVAADQLSHLAMECQEHLCKARAGEALLMRPLLLHASSRSNSGGHRRVLHIEYAGFKLPEPLEWAD